MSLYRETLTGLAESETLSMRGDSMHENRPPARLRPVGDYAPEGRAYASERRSRELALACGSERSAS